MMGLKFPSLLAPYAVDRNWPSRKQQPTSFGDRKNRPSGKYSPRAPRLKKVKVK